MPKVAPDTHSFRAQLGEYREFFEAEAEKFLRGKRREAEREAGPAVALVDAVAELVLAGGKRLRPALIHFACQATHHSPAAAPNTLPLALAAELLHTYLLLHDDIMDHADLRRGLPTAQERFRQLHEEAGWPGDAPDYGRSMAILAGDLAASYAFELAAGLEAPPERAAAVAKTFAVMAQEVIHGQYLEVLVTFSPTPTEEDLTRVLRLKSGRYSVERPLELGAMLAGAKPAAITALKRAGQALGEAFQLRDDLLGMFGEAEKVGKPVGADWVEGKFTFLTFHALALAAPLDRDFLVATRGSRELSSAERERVLSLLRSTGAAARVQAMINERLALARAELASLDLAEPGAAFLFGLADFLEEPHP